MADRYEAFRFRLYPTPRQEQAMLRQAGAARWVWNWALALRIEEYKATGKAVRFPALCKRLTALRASPETRWLAECAVDPQQQSLRILEQAFANFFAKRSRFPRFKGKKRTDPSFRCAQGFRLVDGRASIPKVGRVRVRGLRPFDGQPRTYTIRRSAAGRWFLSFSLEARPPVVDRGSVDLKTAVGVDLGLKEFAVLSTGERIATPKFYQRAQRLLRRSQRAASRRQPGSKRHEKAKRRAARIHQVVADKRDDFLHKLTARLVADHGIVCVEDLNLSRLARTKLAKGFHDASMGEFRRQLAYKAERSGKRFVVVDRFFPSSRLCRGCGAVNAKLTLVERAWICSCGLAHDRDLNAAFNIQQEGLRLLAAGYAESRNARGVLVRPSHDGEGR